MCSRITHDRLQYYVKNNKHWGGVIQPDMKYYFLYKSTVLVCVILLTVPSTIVGMPGKRLVKNVSHFDEVTLPHTEKSIIYLK